MQQEDERALAFLMPIKVEEIAIWGRDPFPPELGLGIPSKQRLPEGLEMWAGQPPGRPEGCTGIMGHQGDSGRQPATERETTNTCP